VYVAATSVGGRLRDTRARLNLCLTYDYTLRQDQPIVSIRRSYARPARLAHAPARRKVRDMSKRVAALLVPLLLIAVAFAGIKARDNLFAAGNSADAFSIDMNIAGNTPSNLAGTSPHTETLGPTDTCAQLNPNGIQDAD